MSISYSQVRELFPGDIYVGNLVSPSMCNSALGYQDRYGTVECSSTAKIIRIYQLSTDNEEAILKVSVYYNLIRWKNSHRFCNLSGLKRLPMLLLI